MIAFGVFGMTTMLAPVPLMVKECDTKKIDCNGHYGCGQLVPVTMKVCKNCGYVFRTEQFEYQLHLEEGVSPQSEANTIEIPFCAEKRLEGWNFVKDHGLCLSC